MNRTIRTYQDIGRPLAFVLLLAIAGTGCAGTSTNSTRTADGGEKVTVAPGASDPALEDLDPRFTIIQSGGKYILAMEANAAGLGNSPPMAALRSIESVTFEIRSSDDDPIDALTTEEIPTSGIMKEGGESALTASASVRWEGSPGPGGYGVMTVRSARGVAIRRTEFPEAASSIPPSRSMGMSLDLNESAAGVEFVLRAERLAPGAEGEYLPSGEQFRIEIQNERGETIWSSNNGMGYTQAIGRVEPDVVGEQKEFSVFWDGRSDLSHTRLSPGRYRVVARIPAKPQPYMLTEELNWSGR